MTIGCYVVHVIVMSYCYYHISLTSRRVHATMNINKSVTVKEAIEIKGYLESRTTVVSLDINLITAH